MAKYNTFVVYDCKKRKNLLVTSSARKAKKSLYTGVKIEVWNNNNIIDVIYNNISNNLNRYLKEEKEYIKIKQVKAEEKNKRRKNYVYERRS